ncbi:MAG: TonB-dependent receptor, partial [Pseudomonadales bacterium]
FTHNIVSLTDSVNLTLGLRYVDERKRGGLVSSTGSNPNCAGAGGANPTVCNPVFTPASETTLYDLYPNAKFEDEAFTYVVGLALQLDEDSLLYASVSEGFKSGGLNLDITGTGSSDPTFESEEVLAYEIGVKTKLASDRVIANLSIFHMEIDDFQLLTFSGTAFSVFNVDKAESSGVELDVDAQVADNLIVDASLVYNDASFPSDCASASAPPTAHLQCGKDLPNAPEFVAVLGADWTLSLGQDVELVLTPNARYESRSQPATFQPSYKQDSTTVIDLRASFQSKDERFSVEVWGKNLTDEGKLTRAFDTISNLIAPPSPPAAAQTSGSLSSWVIDPRTYGVTFRSKF